jgi:Bacterial cadherin-like domain
VGQNGNAGGFTTVATDIVLAGAIGTNLSALGNYGGPTQTHALLPGSAAINAAGTGAIATDQRGSAAVGNRDIGAFESRGFSITPTSGTPQSVLTTAAFGNPLVASVSSAFGEPVNGGRVTFTAPNTGASTTVTTQTATIAAGQVSVRETANSLVGTYTVTASANGIATPANFSLTNANTRPVVTNFDGVIGREDTPINFSIADFTRRFSDANGDRLTKIQITTLPTQGSLQLGGNPVTQNQEITTAQLSTLTYIPNPNSNGVDSFGWNGSDSTDYAATSATVNLTIAPVNDAPSFTKGANQTAIAGSSVRTVINWATNFIPGPRDEAGQRVQQYQIVSNSNPGLFAVQPAIDSTGKLTYTPVRAINRTQTATLILQVKDNGGLDNGGLDTSATQSFTITVDPRICPILTVFQSLPKLSKSSQRLLDSQPPALRQLFDEEFYLGQNPDVAAAVARRSFQSGFEHFLRNGQYEGRDPSGLYNDRYYLSQNPDVAAAVARGNFRSGFQHFLRYGESEGRNASTLYNEQTYLAENPDVAAAVARGNFRSGLQHFLQHGFAEGRVPNLTLFNERYYLSQNPDVAAAVSRGRFTSGLQHFERFGQFEGRQPSTLFNERYYLSQNPDVAAAVAQGKVKSGFDHFLDFGRFEGRAGID